MGRARVCERLAKGAGSSFRENHMVLDRLIGGVDEDSICVGRTLASSGSGDGAQKLYPSSIPIPGPARTASGVAAAVAVTVARKKRPPPVG